MADVLSSQQLNAVHQLLDRVAERQRQDFGNIVSDLKPDGTLITTCDRWSEEAIVAGLAEIAPGEGVLSEEGSKCVPSSQAFWVVDPLDGTTNFAAGIPYWAISLARWVDGQPSEVFLDVPSLRQRIVAIRGKGAWRNGKRLTPETRLSSDSACVSLCSRSIRVLQRRPERRRAEGPRGSRPTDGSISCAPHAGAGRERPARPRSVAADRQISRCRWLCCRR